MMLDPDEVLRGVALPGIAATGLLLLAWGTWGGGAAPTPRRLNGLAVGLAFAAGLLAINRGWPAFPPRGYRDWLVLLGPTLGMLALLLPVARRLPRLPVRPLLLGIFAAAVVGVLLPGRSHALGPAELWTWLLLAFLCLHVAMLSTDAVSTPLPAWVVALVLALYAGVGACLLGAAGSRLLAQYGAALAATTGAAFLVSLLLRRFTLAEGGAATLVALLGAILLVGVLFSEMPRHEAALLLLGPLALWLGRLVPSRLRWQRAVAALVASMVPLAVVAVLGGQRFLAVLREAAELGY